MGDLIVIAVLAILMGLIGWKLINDRKQGVKCPGCEHGKDCAH